jgi:formylglycine-generating enzyme required for sulfatase activity
VFFSGLFSPDHLPRDSVTPAGRPPPLLADCSGPVAAFFASQCHDALTVEQERGLRRTNSFRECADCPEMVVLPAGRFTMGSPDKDKDRDTNEGQHDVTIDKPFAVGRQHVTVAQYAAFVRETGYQGSSTCWTLEGGKSEPHAERSWSQPGFPQEPSYPAVCVSWGDAKAYVDWLANRTHKPYRLPAEAEWEYAARGQTQPGVYPRFWFGDVEEKDLCTFGNFLDRKAQELIQWPMAPGDKPPPYLKCDDGFAYASPVGHYRKPNAFGLDDMAGNAWQWTADCYDPNYNGAPAGGCGNGHVVRGGGWRSYFKYARAAQRYERFEAYNYVGFRVARTLQP